MKQIFAVTLLSLAASGAFAQTANSGANSGSNSSSGSIAGANVSDIGNSSARANSSSGALSGSLSSARTGDQTVNSRNQQAQQQQQGQVNGQSVEFTSINNGSDSVKTVGNPGAVSYGVSFSQYNCANTAAIGGGWLGGVLQLGGPLESGPCNARANASALFQMAQSLAATDPKRSAQLYNAAILLIGNSTAATQQALQTAGVSEWKPDQKSSDATPAHTTLSQNCPANYCGNDPLIKARLGIQ
jgi:hypothetical protein